VAGAPVSLWVNERPHAVDVPPHWTLLQLLTEELGLTGTKDGCGQGVCGACTVLVDGQTVRACLYLAVRAGGRRVVTVEGLRTNGTLHRLQQAFIDEGAVQCGFCTPGMLLAAAGLLAETPHPTEEDVREALVGNLCRCTGYARIVRAVLAAAGAPAESPR
jgi:carbon-monoxide dehydrogenase small subunit